MPTSGAHRPQRPVVEALETKLLYSADPSLGAFTPETDAALNPSLSSQATMAVLDSQVDQIAQHPPREIAFVDASVTDAAGLVRDIEQQASQGRAIEVVLIRSDEDGIARITQALQGQQHITAIHLIGHGHAGGMQLGTTELDAQALLDRAEDIAHWGQALSAEADLLLYGCDVAQGTPGHELLQGLSSLTGADVAASDDLTGAHALGGDWVLEARTGQIDSAMAIGASMQAQWQALLLQATPSSKGTAIWAENGDAAAQQKAWDGLTLGEQTNTATLSTWKVMTSASSPTRNEAIAVGVDASGTVRAQRWDGTQWSAIPTNPLATGTVADRQGFAVAYEQNSGDAVLVWNNGTTLRYSVFNGTTWTTAASISAYGGTAPQQMRLAASPTGDSMVLVVSDASGDDRALVWNGSSWGNAVTLDASGTGAADQLSTAVAYESLSGHAMVAYAKAGDANVYYRMFNGSTWSNEAAVGSFAEAATPLWITLASDPTSDRIALGVLSTGAANASQVSLAVWGGSSWGTRQVAASYTDATPGANVALAFESRSGDLLAVYGADDSAVRYRTWTNAGGWSAQATGPTTGQPGMARLFADPATNHIMMGVQSESGAISFTNWDGSAFGATQTVTANSGSSTTPAFTWLWRNDVSGNKTHTLLVGSASDGTGWRGVNSVGDSEVLSFGQPDVSYGDGSTYGNFSHLVDFEAMGAQGVDDIVVVSRDLSIASGYNLLRGDLLFTTGAASTLVNADGSTVTVDNYDVVRFRPTVAGDYSQGTFTVFVQDLGSTRVGASLITVPGPNVRGLALVEQSTTVANRTLAAGTLLFTSGTGTDAATIQYLTLGSGSLLGGVLVGANASDLIVGSDININQAITGLEVISASTQLENVTLNAGSLLFTLEQADNNVGDLGTPISMNRGDVAILTAPNASQATASILMRGSQVGITSQALDSLALQLAAAPVITSNGGGSTASISVNENTTAVTTVSASDADGDTLVYSITGGADARRFQINASTGALSFGSAMDFEDPISAADSNAYQVTVSVSDGTFTDTQAITVNVVNVNEAPVLQAPPGMGSILGYNYMEVPTGNPNVLTIRASDPEGQAITYSLGGLSANSFTVNASTGVVKLKSTQNADGDDYLLTLIATDASDAQSSLSLVITARDGISPSNDYAPTPIRCSSRTVSVTEEQTFVTTVQASDGDYDSTLTYSITESYRSWGGSYGSNDSSIFQINAVTGELRFQNAPTYSSTGDNSYQVKVRVSDGSYSATQTITVNVLDHNDPPVNTLPGSFTASEDNAASLTGISVADEDAGSSTISVTFSVQHGTLSVLNSVSGGVGSGGISYANGNRQVTLTGSASAINATLANANGLRYQADANHAGSDTLTMVSNDQGNSGQAYSPALTTDTDTALIVITSVADATVALASSGTLSYTENASATPIDAGLTLNDVDGASITGASVRISGNYVNGQDVLSFVNQGGITGSWDAGTGTLTLSGTGTIHAWQTALRAVSYHNTSDAPNTAQRTVTFSVTDAGSTVTTTRGIAITATNDLPVLSTTGSALTYTENAAATTIDPGLGISDVDSSTFTSATVRITGNHVPAEDVLSFTNQLGITGSWDATTGTLTLSGSASAASYQTALRSIAYRNTSDNPSTATRTVTFSVIESNGTGSATRNIAITAVNDAPTLVTTAGSQTHGLGEAPTAVDPTLVLSDPDTATLSGATIRVSNNYDNGDDVLGFTNQSGITGSWNAGTGTLTLTGSASVAAYQAALRSVTYVIDGTLLASTAPRTITFTVDDGSGSVSASRDVQPTNNNNAPTLSTTGTALAYTEGATSVVDASLLLSDSDSPTLSVATIRITGNHAPGQDVLGFTDQLGLSGSWDAGTGTLTLSGSASVSDFQTALRSITYTNTSDNPSTATRTITFTVEDGGNSVSATRSIAIAAVDDAPTISTSSGALTYTENDAATAIDPGLSFGDPDSATITGAVVRITGNYNLGQDELRFTTQAGITGTWQASTGTLTLSGNASPADYQTALRSVAYRNTSDNPNTVPRTVSFIIDEAGLNISATRDITIAAVNDGPLVVPSSGSMSFREGDAPTSIDAGLLLSDVDSATLTGATIQISDNYREDQDILSFTDQAGITGTWQAETGTLVLTGTASVADYQAALRSITYANSHEDPNTNTRTLTFTVNDGDRTSTTGRYIAITAVNDAPVLTTSGTTLAYTEGDAATPVEPGLSLSDVDNTPLTGATVKITGNFAATQDTLVFTDQAGITGTWDSGTGTLTLSGNATTAAYEAALRSVSYVNNSTAPDTSTRTITFFVNDGTGEVSAQREVQITALSDPPSITTNGTPLAYTENDAATAVDPDLVLSADGSGNFIGATAQITGAYDATQDLLAFTDQLGITSTWDAETGTLTLMGNASIGAYQSALRAITYLNSSDLPGTATRTVTFSFSDGLNTTSATRDIAITTVPDAPSLSAGTGTLAYTENDAATAIAPALSIADVDSSNLTGATVAITGPYLPGEDALLFDDQAGITGSWNSATGILTLSGTASVADYQAALRSVRYANGSDDPDVRTRTITFSVTDGDHTTTATRDIALTAVDDAPVMTSTGMPLNYTENNETPVDPGLLITDVDAGMLQGVVVQITAHYLNGEDVLAFGGQAGITGTWNASTGTLVLSGTASAADYQAALRSITYRNTSDNPDTSRRTVTFQIEHSSGIVSATRDIDITAVADAPTLGIGSGPLVYTENGPAAVIAPALSLNDPDTATLNGASVRISGQYVAGQDVLGMSNQPGIAATWNASTGTLNLSGTASIADYQAALRSITYHNSADNPQTATRTVTFEVNDGTGAVTATQDIQLIAVNDGPQLVGNTLSIVQAGTARPVIVIADPDTAAADLTITVSQLSGGQFIDAQTSAALTSFTYSDVQAGLILFKHDGGFASPSYTLTVSDGQIAGTATAVEVSFLPLPPTPAPSNQPEPEPSPEPVASPAPPAENTVEDKPAASSGEAGNGALSQAEQALALAAPGAGLESVRTPMLERERADPVNQNRFLIEALAAEPARPQAAVTPLLIESFRLNWSGDLQALINPEELRRNLDALQEQLLEHGAERRNVVASSIALTTGLSVGYVIWLVRGGALLGSMLSAMPAWQMIDPLPVLTRGRGGNGEPLDAEDDQPVEHLFDDHQPGDTPEADWLPPAPPQPPPDAPGRAHPEIRS